MCRCDGGTVFFDRRKAHKAKFPAGTCLGLHDARSDWLS